MLPMARLAYLGVGQAGQGVGLAKVVTFHCASRVKELPVAISEHAFFVEKTWLEVGFELLSLPLD